MEFNLNDRKNHNLKTFLNQLNISYQLALGSFVNIESTSKMHC